MKGQKKILKAELFLRENLTDFKGSTGDEHTRQGEIGKGCALGAHESRWQAMVSFLSWAIQVTKAILKYLVVTGAASPDDWVKPIKFQQVVSASHIKF